MSEEFPRLPENLHRDMFEGNPETTASVIEKQIKGRDFSGTEELEEYLLNNFFESDPREFEFDTRSQTAKPRGDVEVKNKKFEIYAIIGGKKETVVLDVNLILGRIVLRQVKVKE